MLDNWTDRLVDRLARRPAGTVGRLFYRRPFGHMAGFRRTLARVPLDGGDVILEVACGAGVFLEMALRSGCRACAIDHSPDMLDEARRRNGAAVAEERLILTKGDVTRLPYGDGVFSKVFCFNAFFFFPDPQAALREMTRVAAPGAVVAIVTASPGTARWVRRIFGPMARRMRFDSPETLGAWAAEAGLVSGEVADMPGSGFLFLARKPGPGGDG